jgi:hypothetical protein
MWIGIIFYVNPYPDPDMDRHRKIESRIGSGSASKRFRTTTPEIPLAGLNTSGLLYRKLFPLLRIETLSLARQAQRATWNALPGI